MYLGCNSDTSVSSGAILFIKLRSAGGGAGWILEHCVTFRGSVCRLDC
jgi:hypothetical protein